MASTTSKTSNKFKLHDLSSITYNDMLNNDAMLIEHIDGTLSASYQIKPTVLAKTILSCIDFTTDMPSQSSQNMLSVWYAPDSSTKMLIKQVALPNENESEQWTFTIENGASTTQVIKNVVVKNS